MRLSINDWPPLVTHFLCLFLGTLLSNLQAPPAPEAASYPRQKASIALPRSYLAEASSWPDQASGEPLLVSLVSIDEQTQQPRCRLPPDFLTLMQRVPFPVVEVASQELHWLVSRLPPLARKRPRLLPLAKAAALVACPQTPRVSYGSP